ncbi:hypothetical protein SAMN05192583_0167 [Sphingomonas gellani]|uniref:Uncharacterized protein n=2 Tax=Sphingomonas gellani TaxID=1166340 RepID=A0A1H7Y9J9_9SPHN|nr:hypothetical protein SAMN05192583_0167 [Sphingomonas gellani]
MGWLALLVLGLLSFGGLVTLRVPRLLWSVVGAALMLGATGYAVQGSPLMPTRAARPSAERVADDPALTDLRDRMLGRYTGDGAYQVAADAMTRAGDDKAAVQVILGGLRRVPNSLLLWNGLGMALTAHDGNQVSPPALFAFQQAARLGPEHPAPPFFLGLAYVRAGDFAKARPLWARAMTLSPDGASYKRDIALRLALLDRYLTMAEQR